MSKDIKQKVKTCPTCQLTKRPVGPTYGELSQPPESKEPFDLLSLDTIAGFAKYGNTKIYLHVVVDHFSRYAWAFPSKSTSTTTYQQVLKRVFQDGSPKRLLTDRAPAFTSPKFRSFLLNRNIHPLLTTSNNPQANGLCERLNATLTGKLRLLHLENPKVAWTKLVKKVTLIYNKTPHSTTSFPPIYLMFGILPPEISNHNTPYPDIDKARKIAHTRTQNKHLQDKNTYDQRHKQPHFEVGDLVLVKLYHHPNTGKLAPYFTGPHTILEIISPNVVRIDRPNQPLQRDTDTIHVNKLKLYTEKIHYISPPAVSTYHIKHNPNYTFPFKHLTPELFPTESLRFKPTSSEPFRHLDPAIFATRRFTSLFPDVKNCKPDNQLNHITPPPKDIKQESYEPTNHSNSTINKRCTETSEALHWTRQQQQKIDMNPELYTSKIENIAVIEIGRTSLEDDPREGRSKSANTPETFEKFHIIMLDDRRVNVSEIAEGILEERVRNILHEELGIPKLCIRWIPHFLNADQKQMRKRHSQQCLDRFKRDPTKVSLIKRFMKTSETLLWIRQRQKIDMDPKKQLYTPKIVDIAAAVIEMYEDI
ncbi:hypothetical protein LAZ67_1005706 [Cordylochernes scorpioides]|uniref:Integrase catalytic domain-containing protein n=1 Tax=Cordylochernes scorpioides TaxID=51811 RepID=A0ABY6JYK0_9ARAC|nr:hypothetical protein LAZ67_1005706 [Cordylochernes scorpioides]